MENESFHILFENLPLGVVFLGPTGAVVAANPRARDILGLQQDQMLNQKTYDPPCMVREDGSAFERAQYPSVVAQTTGKPVENVNMRLVRPCSGIARWLNVSAIPLFSDDRNTVRGVLLTLLDITEQKSAERELINMAKFPGENPNPVVRITREGTITYANKASLPVLEQGRVLGGQTIVEKIRESCALLSGAGQCHSFEVQTSGKTFEMMVCQVQNESYFNVYGVETTKRKQSEKALLKERDFSAAVVHMAGSLVVVADREGRIQRFNHACEEATGYTFQDAEGQVFWDLLLPPDAAEQVKHSFTSMVPTDFPSKQENHWRTKDGRTRLIAWSNTALLGDDGQVEYVISTGTDITEKREAEKFCEREMHTLEGMTAPPPAGFTAASLGLKQLREASPALFSELTKHFAELLEKSVEMLAMKVEYEIPREIDEISEQLGTMRAGPRDATEIFLAALNRKCSKALPERCRAYREEGRILLIELIGKLAVYYRNHCLGMPSQPPEYTNRENKARP